MSEGTDVLVIGAGPAGALAARELARAGQRVLLVDRQTFPRDKVCGGCLLPATLAVLEAHGLGALPLEKGGVSLRHFELRTSGGRRARLDLPGGVALSRRRFDQALVDAAVRAGVTFLDGTRASLGPVEASRRTVELVGAHADRSAGQVVRFVRASLVVAADGLAGAVMSAQPGVQVRVAPDSYIGAGVVVDDADESAPAGVIRMACASGGYVGFVRVEEGRLCVAAALSPAAVRRHGGLGAAVAAIMQETALPPLSRDLPWAGTPALTRTSDRPWAERVLALGDAAGYVEPFTGEGIAWALASSSALARLARAGWSPTLGEEWARARRRLLGSRQRRCRGLTRALRYPWVARTCVRLLSWWPRLGASWVSARVSAPVPHAHSAAGANQ